MGPPERKSAMSSHQTHACVLIKPPRHHGSVRRFRLLVLVAWCLLCCAVWGLPVQADPPQAQSAEQQSVLLKQGATLYTNQCAKCHGKTGQGNKEHYSDPLAGDTSIKELTEIIETTMPESDPDQCIGDDAAAVAAYIYESFYQNADSGQVVRRSFSRLTGAQLQQSLADLYQHFHSSAWIEEKRGLEAFYFNAGRWDNKKLTKKRIDPILDFQFGKQAPIEGVDAKEFYIHWTGSVIAPQTGRYQFVVESTCSMKLRFGSDERTLINNHVQSEGKTEFRRTLNLIAGRQYPISIDFTQRKRKTEQPAATFSLRWVPPGGIEHVIPSESLIPNRMPPTFALQTKLPPDDHSYGYDRGTRVDSQWDQAVTQSALEFGALAAKELWPHYKRKNKDKPNEDRALLKAFLTELAQTAFREPLSEPTRKRYILDQLAQSPDDQMAIARCCLLIIKSPRFLYPMVDDQSSLSQRVAKRLSLVLHDSLPSDSWLIGQAKNGHFDATHKQFENRVRQAADRMTRDPRIAAKVNEMFYQWLDLETSAEMVKSEKAYPEFDAHVAQDLKRSLDQTINRIFWDPNSDYRQLFRRDWNWTTPALARVYGQNWQPIADPSESANPSETSSPSESETADVDASGQPAESSAESSGSHKYATVPDPNRLVQSQSNPQQTLGVLTHPMVLANLSYHDVSSPVHRGVFLIRHVLGRALRPPNEAFTPFNPELHPDLTTRERVELQTGEAKCQVCHTKINGLGYTLENYDAIGRFRTMEKSKAINATGNYTSTSGQTVEFKNAKDLANFLADNPEAHRAFVERSFEHFVKQPLSSYGSDVEERLVKHFQQTNFNMRRLIIEIAVVVATEIPNGDS